VHFKQSAAYLKRFRIAILTPFYFLVKMVSEIQEFLCNPLINYEICLI